jgi:hypothetical protein
MAKKDRRPPSTARVLILGCLSLLFGAVLGLVSLATQPVQEVSVLPKEEDREPGAVYYVRGSEASGQRWRAKEAAFLQSVEGVYVITTGELNQWARTTFKPDLEAEEGGAEVKIRPTAPNFRIEGESLQISTYLTVPQLGAQKYVYQVRGQFAAHDDGVRFRLEEADLGRAPIGSIPVLGPVLHNVLVGVFANNPSMEPLHEPWTRVRAIDISGADSLRVTVR